MSETHMPWPDKNNQAFAENRFSDVEAFLEGLEDSHTDGVLSDAFRQAGDAIVESVINDSARYMPTRLLLPIAYVYRHSLELEMKSILADAVQYGVLCEDDNLKGIMAGHNLHRLWNRTRSVIEELWPNEDWTPLDASERVILEFHKIDPSGQGFRYAYDKNDQRCHHVDSVPKKVDLRNLRDVVDGVLNFLGSTASAFDYMSDGY